MTDDLTPAERLAYQIMESLPADVKAQLDAYISAAEVPMRFLCGNDSPTCEELSNCHCGAPQIWHADTDTNGNPGGWTRHLCQRCDDARCDAYPGACGR